MTCYAIGATKERVKTACGRRVMHSWTTAALRADCPSCIDSSAWESREGRFGIGDPTAPVHDEIAMHPHDIGTRFKRRQNNN